MGSGFSIWVVPISPFLSYTRARRAVRITQQTHHSTLIRTGSVDERNENHIQENGAGHPNTQREDPRREAAGDVGHGGRPDGVVSSVPSRSEHRHVQRGQHHGEMEQRRLVPLYPSHMKETLTLLRHLHLHFLISRFGIHIGRFGVLARGFGPHTVTHPVAADDDEGYVDDAHEVGGVGDEGVAGSVGLREERAQQVEGDDEEEEGGREESAIDLVGHAEKAAARVKPNDKRYTTPRMIVSVIRRMLDQQVDPDTWKTT